MKKLLLIIAILFAPYYVIAQYKDTSLYLKKIIETHPKKEIRQDLHAMIDTGTVFLNFESDIAAGGLATVFVIDINDQPKIVLNIDSNILMDPHISNSYRQLVLFHEFQHIKQILQKKYPIDSFRIKEGKNPIVSPSEIANLYHAELEAYTAECSFAKEIKVTGQIEICSVYSKKGITGLKSYLKKFLQETYKSSPKALKILKNLK